MDSRFTDTCYYNKRLVNSDGHNPVFLGPTLIHFIKDQKSPKIRNLHTIGTDHEMVICNGFSSVLPNLNLFLCIYHLEQADKQKISNLVLQKGAKQSIIATTVSTVAGTLEFKNMVWQILQIMTTFMQNQKDWKRNGISYALVSTNGFATRENPFLCRTWLKRQGVVLQFKVCFTTTI